MKKRVVDLSPQELDSAASYAWKNATQAALARGIAVTGSRDGRRFRYHPDGHVEDLGPVAPLDDLGTTADQLKKLTRRSIS